MCCVCPISQVASWSSEAVPSSRGPIRSVTGKLRHCEPSVRQGGTAGPEIVLDGMVTAMLSTKREKPMIDVN
jgi:hypothetical protein